MKASVSKVLITKGAGSRFRRNGTGKMVFHDAISVKFPPAVERQGLLILVYGRNPYTLILYQIVQDQEEHRWKTK